MSHPYTTLVSGGDVTGAIHMHIRLYPHTSSEEDNLDSQYDIVPEALWYACEDLRNDSVIDYYKIDKWVSCDGTYPGDENADNVNTFEDWLQNDTWYPNGCGEDLTQYKGSHVLAVDWDECSTNTADAQQVSCGTSGSAWNSAATAMTPVDGCPRSKLQASAIQEVFHNFIIWDHQDVQSWVNDSDGDEHALGKIDSNGDVTPLLTYHENEMDGIGCCSTSNLPGGYTTEYTHCTRMAMDISALDPDCSSDYSDGC